MTDYTLFKRTVFFGLSDEVAAELCDALSNVCNIMDLQVLVEADENIDALRSSPVDVIFCGSNTRIIQHLREQFAGSRIIAVDRIPDSEQWISAIEAGADDYTAIPRGPVEMRWLAQSNFRAQQRLAA